MFMHALMQIYAHMHIYINRLMVVFLNFFFVVNFSLFIALLRESAAGKAASKKKKAAMYGLTQFKDWRAAK